MTDILKNVLNIAARIHDMQAAGTLARRSLESCLYLDWSTVFWAIGFCGSG